MIKVYGVRCYARRLGASGCNAHAKAQAALGPGLRRTSHAIVQPLRPPFLSFSLPPTHGELGEERRLVQVLFLDYHQTKTLNNADNLFSKQKFEHKESNREKDKYTNQSTVGLRFKTAIPTKWRSWCVGDSRHMVDSVRPAIFGKHCMQKQPYELFFILSPRRPILTLLRKS